MVLFIFQSAEILAWFSWGASAELQLCSIPRMSREATLQRCLLSSVHGMCEENQRPISCPVDMIGSNIIRKHGMLIEKHFRMDSLFKSLQGNRSIGKMLFLLKRCGRCGINCPDFQMNMLPTASERDPVSLTSLIYMSLNGGMVRHGGLLRHASGITGSFLH